MDNEFLRVSELNHFIRDVLNSGFPAPVWVCGEIQGYDRSKDKKHIFFELCEKEAGSNEIVARVALVMFATVKPKIEALLKKTENSFELKDDIEVKFLCKVDFYPGHGQVRLIVENIDPVHTLGKIAQDRLKLIAALKQKGTLEINKRLEIPRVPLNIGLITSHESAAYHDFIDEIRRSGFSFKVFITNTLMQGKSAEASVIKSLKRLNAIPNLDVVVITRGGGSIAELSCFDSALIAEAIAVSRLPIISGIGHEINTTITDLAAHTYAKTPTAVAQYLIGRVYEFAQHLEERQEVLFRLLGDYWRKEQIHLKDSALRLKEGTRQTFNRDKENLLRINMVLKNVPTNKFKDSRRQMGDILLVLQKTIQLRLTRSRTRIHACQKLVEMADPLNTLKRGFSITRTAKGNVLKSVKQLGRSKDLITQLADGMLNSKVN